jgi:hypothetical protein
VDEDTFNLSVRKFLKEFGVTSQRVLEKAVREAQESGELDGVATLGVTMTLEVPAFELTHVIAGDVELG